MDSISAQHLTLKAPHFLREHLRGSDRIERVFIHAGCVSQSAISSFQVAGIGGKNGALSL